MIRAGTEIAAERNRTNLEHHPGFWRAHVTVRCYVEPFVRRETWSKLFERSEKQIRWHCSSEICIITDVLMQGMIECRLFRSVIGMVDAVLVCFPWRMRSDTTNQKESVAYQKQEETPNKNWFALFINEKINMERSNDESHQQTQQDKRVSFLFDLRRKFTNHSQSRFRAVFFRGLFIHTLLSAISRKKFKNPPHASPSFLSPGTFVVYQPCYIDFQISMATYVLLCVLCRYHRTVYSQYTGVFYSANSKFYV